MKTFAGSGFGWSFVAGSLLPGRTTPVQRPLLEQAQVRMASPPVFRAASSPVQARMAAPGVFRPSTSPVQRRVAAPASGERRGAQGSGVAKIGVGGPSAGTPVLRKVPASAGNGENTRHGSLIQAKPVYVSIKPDLSKTPKKQRAAESALAAKGDAANLQKIVAAKDVRKKMKDAAHAKWIAALDRAGNKEGAESARWAAHHAYADVRAQARTTYEQTLRGLTTNTGIVGLPGVVYGSVLIGDSGYEEIKLEGAKRTVYRRKDAPDKEYVKDAYGAYVRRKCFRCITTTEATTIEAEGLARKSLEDLSTQAYTAGALGKYSAFAASLETNEEQSRDVLHQIIGGGQHQFQISATSSLSRPLRSNAGLGFDTGAYGGTYEIDLAMVPAETHVAAQYTINARQQRTAILAKASLPPSDRNNISDQVFTSAEKNIEVLLGSVPKEAIRKIS